MKNKEDVALALLPFYNSTEAINRQDMNGEHALLYATFNKSKRMARELLKMGANADLTDNNGTSPLLYCVYCNDVATLHELLPYAKKFDVRLSLELLSGAGMTPIEVCEENNRFNILYMILLSGAKLTNKIVANIGAKYRRSLTMPNHDKTVAIAFEQLKFIHEFVNTPLSLKRQCRCFIKLNNLFDARLDAQIPADLKKFLIYDSL